MKSKNRNKKTPEGSNSEGLFKGSGASVGDANWDLENLKAAVALHFAHYNFVRIHKTLACTPVMEAGVDNRLWTIGDLLELAN